MPGSVSVNPKASAGNGRHVWVYGEGSGRIDEVDTRTNRVIERPLVGIAPPAYCCGLYTGPVLAADASGAWFVHGGFVGNPQLVHLPVGRRLQQSYRLPITPTGVAVGADSVWVVGFTPHDDEVLRIDPTDGRVTATWHFPASARIGSIAFGYGWVWAESSTKATLYRIDPKSPGLRPRKLALAASHTTRPEMVEGQVFVRSAVHRGEVFRIDPSPLKWLRSEYDGPPIGQENIGGLGARWWYDSPTGTVVRQTEENGPKQTIHVTRVLPAQGGPCLTSITTAGGSVWVTAAPMVQVGNSFLCGR